MYKVLIVDDEKIVKLAIKSMIKWGESGFELAGTAGDGSAALQLCEKHNPDIVITDLKMPKMDGIEFIKRLKERKYQGEILVLSNYNDFELVKEAMKYGVHDYILKVTVKSDDFMRVLGEMGEKLDKKRVEKAPPLLRTSDPEFERVNSFKRLLNSRSGEAVQEVEWVSGPFGSRKEESIQVFTVLCGERDPGARTGQGLGEIFKNIVSNLSFESDWQSVVEMDGKSVFIALHYPKTDGIPPPGKMADRVQELAGMYFNLKVGVVYGNNAPEGGMLLQEIRKCRNASELFFYDAFKTSCLPGDLQLQEDEKCIGGIAAFAVESVYMNMLKGQQAGIAEGFEKMAEAASQGRLNPYRLKKNIKKVLREAERELMKNGVCEEEVFDPYYNDEDAIFVAASQTELLNSLGEILKKALEKIPEQKAYRKEIREALQYIEQNACEKLTVHEIARRVNLTDTYLCKVFKLDVGKSLIDYINGIKVKKAYELISSGNYLVKEAAAAVGIDDQFYFNRLFKKYFGITPKRVKAKMK